MFTVFIRNAFCVLKRISRSPRVGWFSDGKNSGSDEEKVE